MPEFSNSDRDEQRLREEGERKREDRPEPSGEPETIIDVSSGPPEVVSQDAEDEGNFIFQQFGQARIYTTRASGRACLIPIILILLLFSCACIGFVAVVQGIF